MQPAALLLAAGMQMGLVGCGEDFVHCLPRWIPLV
jgi:hypothetical protein